MAQPSPVKLPLPSNLDRVALDVTAPPVRPQRERGRTWEEQGDASEASGTGGGQHQRKISRLASGCDNSLGRACQGLDLVIDLCGLGEKSEYSRA